MKLRGEQVLTECKNFKGSQIEVMVIKSKRKRLTLAFISPVQRQIDGSLHVIHFSD